MAAFECTQQIQTKCPFFVPTSVPNVLPSSPTRQQRRKHKMIIKVLTYIIGGVLAAGFLWYAGKVVVAGISAVNSSHQTTKKGTNK